jgi:hypothetical protein
MTTTGVIESSFDAFARVVATERGKVCRRRAAADLRAQQAR